MRNNFIQYELWKDCKNGCKFCFNRGQPQVNKIISLKNTLQRMDDPELKDYNEIGFIGGEFFDDQLEDIEVKNLFYSLFAKCKTFIDDKKIEKIYFTTSLIFDMDKYLIPFLEYLNSLNLLSNCLLCTSYDLKYRFHTKEKEELWKSNMLKLHELFPNLKLHTEIIATGFFMQAVLDDTFNISEFCDKFHCGIDYIEPGSGFYFHDKEECAKEMPDFFPTKDQVIRFVKKTMIETKQINMDTFVSSQVRSDKVYIYYNGECFPVSNRRKSNCLLDIKNMKEKYEIGTVDSSDTIRKIVNEIGELYGGL